MARHAKKFDGEIFEVQGQARIKVEFESPCLIVSDELDVLMILFLNLCLGVFHGIESDFTVIPE